ncbi:hypothetical protein ACMD2_16123 [Ananas comosus]|uniref:Uncharacterized protein n=1 Tax=Ananas comosus TaxID=4615 RepID=A0A199VSD4_ANACO|nr:hypothetical protein ACMD2_16123 [Ananas comosus]
MVRTSSSSGGPPASSSQLDNDLSRSSSGFEIRECLNHLREREWPLRVQKRLHLPAFEIRAELRQALPVGRDNESEARGDDRAREHHDAAPFFHCFHRSFTLTCRLSYQQHHTLHQTSQSIAKSAPRLFNSSSFPVLEVAATFDAP